MTLMISRPVNLKNVYIFIIYHMFYDTKYLKSPSNDKSNSISTAIITIVVISLTLFEVMPQKSIWAIPAKGEEEHLIAILDSTGAIRKQKEEAKSSLTNAKTSREKEYDEGKQRPPPCHNQHKHTKILIVDDDPNITSNFKVGLENRGFIVDIFNDPVQALSKFKNGAYDLILLDTRMSRMNGFEAYREIQKVDNNVKVCFITAFVTYYESLREIFPTAKDISCFIKKSIDIDKLVERIRAETKV
jgi:CheY-like chemotaxis protein